MAISIIEPGVAAAVAAASSQEAQRAALLAPWAGGDVTVRAVNGATLRETQTYGPWQLNSANPRGATLGDLIARTVTTTGAPTAFVFRAGSADIFSLDAAVSPATADLVMAAALGGISPLARTNLADANVGKVTVSANPALPVTGAVATSFTLALSAANGTNGQVITVTVTPNGPIPVGGASVSLSATNGGILGASSLSFTSGSVAAQTTTLRRDAAGTSQVTMTNTAGLLNGGSPASYTSAAPGAAVAAFTLTAPSTATHPFSLGHAFKQGDIPAGSGIVVAGATAQATIKNAWPDGSAKFAVIAGTAGLTASTPSTVSLSAGTASAGTALTTADLIATGITAAVDAGSFGSASFGNTEWAAPFQAWVSGHRMSSWVYRKPIGSDAHLVAWLEVRLFAGGAVEVLPWVENGYIRVAGPVNKSATYSFTLGGTSRFSAAIDLPARCRTPLVSGAALSHWLGTDPGVTPKHDAAYMQATRLVPKYRATVAADAARVAALPATFTPLQQGSYNSNMAGTGYQPAIGLLPEWDALYLTTTAPAAYGGVVRNAYSAGRYNLHYRDENTNRPLRFSQFPNTSVNASTTSDFPVAATGTAPPVWDIPHHPSVGYMAYLVTGRFFHMETVQFAAARNYLAQVDNQRQFAGGVFLSTSGAATTRGAAWGVRTLLQAATVTPDADTALRAEFVASLEANITFNHGRYVAQANNPFGIVAPYGDAYGTGSDGMVQEAPWQQDFYTAAFGYALAANPPISSGVKTSLAAFFAWKAQSIIGRLGAAGATDWLYRDAAPFTFVVALVDTPDYTGGTGPWPASWRAMYDATYTTSPGAFEPGDLRGGNFPEATSYWGNLQPAIAYAIEHGVSGASAAYLRMKQAANWSTLAAGFNTDPVWGVSPSVEPGLPAWVPAEGQIANIGTSTLNAVKPSGWPSGENGGPVANWGPGVYMPNYGAAGGYAVHSSGHLAVGTALWAGVWVFNLETLVWEGRNVPAAPLLETTLPTSIYNIYFESTEPATLGHTYPPHCYDGIVYQSPANGGAAGYGSLVRNMFAAAGIAGSTAIHQFDLSSATAPPTRVINGVSFGGSSQNYPMSALDESRGGYWLLSYSGRGPLVFIRFSDWSVTPQTGIEYNDYGDQQMVHLPAPYDCLIGFGRTDGGLVNFSYRVSVLTGSAAAQFQPITVSGTPPPGATAGGCWSTILGCIVSYAGDGSSTVYKLTPPSASNVRAGTGTWVWTSETLTGATPADYVGTAGEYAKLQEAPEYKCFLRVGSIFSPLQAFRLTGMS